jgi:hypothetical protein
MKTPRDLLLARHQAAAPKLDAIRREVVARQCASTGTHKARASVGFLTPFWLELVWPCRRFWTGLAAVWVLLVIVNVSQRDGSHSRIAKSPPTAEMMMALRKQEKMLDELLSDRPRPAEATRPRNLAPKQRSETSGVAAV